MTAVIEQALYGSQGATGYQFLARSQGFLDEWLPLAERLCVGFGEHPPDVSCPLALFAQPFSKRYVAVVQVADYGGDDSGRPGTLRFRLFIVPLKVYADVLGGDLFQLSDAYPPVWSDRGELLALHWPPPQQVAENQENVPGSAGGRSVEQLRQVLQTQDQSTLLGAVQVLLDGGKVLFERLAPDPALVRGIWTLMPTASRAEIWPTTFAYANLHRFDLLVLPPGRRGREEDKRYVPESRAANDYPVGNYENQLLLALEAADQSWLNQLLARRSRRQMERLVLVLLVLFFVGGAILQAISPQPPPAKDQGPKGQKDQKGQKAKVLQPKQDLQPNQDLGAKPLKIPAAEEFPRLNEVQRARMGMRLHHLGTRLGMSFTKPVLEGNSEVLAQAIEELDQTLSVRLPDPEKEKLGKIQTWAELGPLQRQFRVLLWRYGVESYGEMKLNEDELFDRLEQHLHKLRILRESD